MHRKRMLTLLSVASLSALAALSSPLVAAAASNDDAKAVGQSRFKNNAYIVQLADLPVTAYDGGIAGYAATKPAKGQKIDPKDAKVIRYLGYLASKQDAALAGAGGGRKLYNYGYVFNGFAAELTAAQAAKLAQMPGVLAVTKDEARKLDTSSTPSFLGLSGTSGFWERTGFKGEGVVIGIVDSGIWPEHPSLSDRTDVNGNGTKDGKLGYQQIPGWNGKCTPGAAFNASNCNQKLIGARYYNEGFGGNAGVLAELPYEFLSPRDYDGHGTHTATTAGGNANVPATGPASVFGKISGMAPRARIAAYKVCWGTGDDGGCFNTDSVAAIDQAVADGVDVINFSISGTTTNFRDAVEIAFLYAADAGVFVAASAGNSGPTTSTVAHPGPWLTTVAAGTHNRDGQGSATLGNGATYSGASIAAAVGPKPLIASTAAGLAGADPNAVRLCFAAVDNGGTPVLDPAKVAGKIVVCDRGVTARVNKSLAVKQAGGEGMILANTSANSINADLHFVPTVHVPDTSRAAILAHAATSGATATINAATIVYNAPAPFTASFSSRGPLRAGGGDLLKPDIIAPGQDIIAGVSPMGHNGLLFDSLSGTSMSSPHIAGIAALFKEARPNWSPMAIKSALMTTAGDVLDGPNTNPLVIFRQGAGHVRPNSALDPGLVFDAGWNDWIAFICATQPQGLTATCNALWNAGYSRDASDLNVASIAIGDMAGVQTVKRRVTNVGGAAATYTASYTGMSGFAVTLPGPVSIAAGETKEIAITFLRTGATANAYTGGQLTLADGAGHVVRVPMVVRPVALAAPAQVSGNGAAINYGVTFGYDGPFSATARGMVPATITAGTVADDPTNGDCSLNSPGAQKIPVAIPLGITYARFSLFDADVNPGSDIDLCVFNSVGTLVGSSGSGSSAEEVNLGNGTLDIGGQTVTVVVQGWGVVGSSPFKLHTWLLGVADAGNMAVSAPASATTAGTGTVSLNFSGLAAGTKYLGSVAYGGTSGMPNPTIVRVDTP